MFKIKPYNTLVCLMAIYMFTTLTYTLWPVSSPNKIIGFLIFFNVVWIYCKHLTKNKVFILFIATFVVGWSFINTANPFGYMSDAIYLLISILLLKEVDSDFSKRAIEIIGPGDTVKSRMDLDEKLDYEVELAVVIGKRGTDIPKEKVEEYIFGYSVFNDISARELQGSHVQWYRGKSLDSFSSMGPVILHKSSLPFPVEVDIRSYVNGEIRQTSNTKLFLSNIGEIISEISSGITLEAGDIVITGTPSGVGLGLKPQKFMKKGDIVVCEIPEIGRLENIIG